jgi:hypothetical protein
MDERTKLRLTTLTEKAFASLPTSNVAKIKERLQKIGDQHQRDKVVAAEYQREVCRLLNLKIQAQEQYITILHLMIEGKLDQETDDKLTEVYERLEEYIGQLNELRIEAANEIQYE